MDLSSLNKDQHAAATAPLGPVLVLAGPGSGKTKTLTYRIAYIIEKRLAAPEGILALTFTNKAAKEMRSRVAGLLARYKGASESLTMGTFHSVCARILRHEIKALGYSNDFVIFDSQDQQKLIKEILEELRVDTKRLPASLFGALISRAKNLLQLPAELNIGLESPLREKLAEVYTRYQDALYKQNALDFDDLLLLTVKVFENFPKVLLRYQKKFTYVLVDEYQDTNPVQYRLLRLLSEHHNLFVVGDDAQSIYKFRGSDITNILNFEKDFPECLVIKLEQNYRSSQNILLAAQKVIELNPEQKPKTLWTQNPVGEKIILACLEDERGEAEFVARNIIKLAGNQTVAELEYAPDNNSDNLSTSSGPGGNNRGYSILDRFIKAKRLQRQFSEHQHASLLPQLPKKHESLKEFCVLYRTHAQSRAIEEVFIEASIPYQIVGGLKFYERKEIKDMLAYLRLTLNFRDLVSLKRVLNEPPRGLGPKSYEVLRELILKLPEGKKPADLEKFCENLEKIELTPKAAASAREFFAQLLDFQNFNAAFTLPELMKLIFKKSGYERSLRDGSEAGEGRVENVLELITVAFKFKHLPWREALTEFLEEVALISEIDQKDESKDAVIMMTLHSAKGLEFDNVFFVGLEEGILPHSRSLIEPDELAEEIRLAYVGLTRARKLLFLLYTQSRRVFGNLQISQPSRILRVLPKERLDLRGPAKEHFNEIEGELTVERMEY